MILAKFYSSKSELVGFSVSGHSGYADSGSDIVCASVSSCAYMVANTVTEIFRLKAEIEVDDGFLELRVSEADAEKVKELFRGFELHLKALEQDYGKYLKVEYETIHK